MPAADNDWRRDLVAGVLAANMVPAFSRDSFISYKDDAVWAVVNHFGICHTAARHQIWYATERQIPLESLQAGPGRRPDERWQATEAFTFDYHPLPRIRSSRAGRFGALVLGAAEERLISWDTAAESTKRRNWRSCLLLRREGLSRSREWDRPNRPLLLPEYPSSLTPLLHRVRKVAHGYRTPRLQRPAQRVVRRARTSSKLASAIVSPPMTMQYTPWRVRYFTM
jgi:hypothetical protein